METGWLLISIATGPALLPALKGSPMRCAVLDDLQGVATTIADWSPLAGRVEVVPFTSHLSGEDALAEALAGFDIVITVRERVPFPESLLARLPKLRLLIATGRRNTVIDLDAARRLGITVCGTDAVGTPTVELTWALLLGLARDLVTENTAFRAGGPWQSTLGADLHGRTLGVIGLGRIGGPVARIGGAFGMDVRAWSRNLTAQRAAEFGAALAPSLDELLATSDFVTVHVPLTESSRGLVDGRRLALMKPCAYLVNTARAALVEPAALLAALRAGSIAGAAIDVFDTEPLPLDDPWRTAPRLLATPHLGYVSRANYELYFRQAVEAVEAYLAGAPIRLL
ncbi:D-2-hydroxyacid dehydrogenase family protein [Actinoplanes sp. NEAU-A12]|uniref:D-2-hydroxyacid dehydrogenase family protein n=1 Tax=Actinoplanes sandaracinus TaxID=3045177 RepID=A0ABT6WNS1_9ACTN|nr:D-2-hydroxyacid dehydrogenase family protein [Actinoplanes sandaracinus]MDI6101358.1 D-2-hydroxyacid dehydrogenase family protein [Actinoplanes sandaracinus]